MSPVRVDFYLLNDTHLDAKLGVACRLLEKAYLNQHHVFVCCETRDEAIALDQRLWTYKEESFVPHALVWENLTPTPPILMGYKHVPEITTELVLNLTKDIPIITSSLQRIMEIVTADETAKITSREHYRTYRAQGFDLHTHTL